MELSQDYRVRGLPAMGKGLRGIMQAPVGGWNTRDAESNMSPEFALQLDNFFPELGRVTTRRGFVPHVTELPTGNVGTLFNWRSGTNSKLFAAAGNGIYDVSGAGPAGGAIVSGLTDVRWRGANFGRNGILVNGVDDPLRIDADGNWTPHGFEGEGLTPSRLFQVLPFKHRLFFAEKGTPNIWYAGIDAVRGPLEKIDLSLVHGQGGNILALGTLTLDGGDGPDDMLAIFTESGDVLVYSGLDPSDASAWSITGRFHVGRVVGDTPLVDLGADLIAITQDGYIPLLQFLKYGRARRQLALSDTISEAATEQIRNRGNDPGWGGILYPKANWLLFNVPISGNRAIQHVMNSQTGAWCRFTGMDAQCWENFNDGLYFGTSDGRVMQADQGTADAGEPVAAELRTAYNFLRSPYDKRITALRSHLESGGGSSVSIGANMDFNLSPIDPIGLPSQESGTPWDIGEWDSFQWGAGAVRYAGWRLVNLYGSAISIQIAALSSGDQVSFFSSDVLYDQSKGSVLSPQA